MTRQTAASEKYNPAAQPGSQDHVLALCHMLSNRIGRVFTAALAHHDVTIAQWRVILTLALHEEASGQEITSRWAMEKMAINRAVASLVTRGLIEKRRNTLDRRSVDLLLTESGRGLYEGLLPSANASYHRLMAGLDQSEAKQLHRLLTKMIAHADTLANQN